MYDYDNLSLCTDLVPELKKLRVIFILVLGSCVVEGLYSKANRMRTPGLSLFTRAPQCRYRLDTGEGSRVDEVGKSKSANEVVERIKYKTLLRARKIQPNTYPNPKTLTPSCKPSQGASPPRIFTWFGLANGKVHILANRVT